MNANRKSAAVKRYIDLYISGGDVINALKEDKSEYTEEEISEIIDALGDDLSEGDDKDKGDTGKAKETPNPFDKVAAVHYQEWEVKIGFKDGVKEVEKLKVSRPVVKISDEEADILNAGVKDGPNTYAKMYFLPE